MRGRLESRREALTLACTLTVALLAITAAPGRSQTSDPNAPVPPVQGGASATPAPAAKATAPQAASAGSAQSATAKASKSTVSATGAKAVPTAATATVATTPGAGAAKKPAVRSTSAHGDSTMAAGAAHTARRKAGAKSAASDTSADYTLRGGQEGTVFKSLTVEGEDRVHIDFERPELKLDLDLEKAPGLEWGSAADVLNRTSSDMDSPLVGLSAKQMNPYLARPWLSGFATGPVARFHPEAQGVESWKLVVVDSKGTAVRTYSGKGDPPREIEWDGRTANGSPATPGITYSYVFEAHDKAGNKRNVVGQGFGVNAYRIDSPEGPTLLFSATELSSAAGAQSAPAAPGASDAPPAPPILLEAASWLNQAERLSQPIRVTATARSQELADALAGNVKRALAPLVLGDPARVDAVALVESDAPEAGTLSIAPGK